MQIYYSNQNGEHCVYIDAGNRQQRVFLPRGVSQIDAQYLAQSEAAKYVIEQLLKGGEA